MYIFRYRKCKKKISCHLEVKLIILLSPDLLSPPPIPNGRPLTEGEFSLENVVYGSVIITTIFGVEAI